MKKITSFLILISVAVLFFSCKKSTEKNKILITAPENYSQRFANSLEKNKLPYLQLPLITTTILDDDERMFYLATHLQNYDWVAFTSRNAIKAFFQYINQNNIDINKYNIRFCPIGKDAELLKNKYDAEQRTKIVAASPQAIVDQLKNFENIHNQHIAVISPRVKGIKEPDVVPNFMDILSRISRAERYDAYQTTIDTTIDIVKWRKIIKNDVEIIAFTSTAEIEAMIHFFGLSFINNKTVACFGPYTAKNARKLGVDVSFVSDDYRSFDGFSKSIKEYLITKHKKDATSP